MPEEQLSPQEKKAVDEIVAYKTALVMNSFRKDYENRIKAIEGDKKQLGKEGAVSKNVPSCKDYSGLYCLGTYTYSLGAAMKGNDVNPVDNGLFQYTQKEKATYDHEKWGSPQLSCPAAANYISSNTDENIAACGTSLQEADPDQTLGDVLKEGHEEGTIKPGALVLVKSTGNSSTGMHATMFAGVNESGEVLFSSANPEKIKQPCQEWANQKASPGNSSNLDCMIIDTEKALARKIEKQETQKIKEIGLEAYKKETREFIDEKQQTNPGIMNAVRNDLMERHGIEPITPGPVRLLDTPEPSALKKIKLNANAMENRDKDGLNKRDKELFKKYAMMGDKLDELGNSSASKEKKLQRAMFDKSRGDKKKTLAAGKNKLLKRSSNQLSKEQVQALVKKRENQQRQT